MKRNLTLFALGIASAFAPSAVMAKDPALSAHAERVIRACGSGGGQLHDGADCRDDHRDCPAG